MQNKPLLFWILNSDKSPLYINDSNNVEAGTGVTKTDGTPAHLKHNPDGWNESLVKWGRNNKYLGLFREFSVPLNFVKDGAKILRNTMLRVGMEAVLYLSISKLNRTAFPDLYEQWYTGELDFSKYKQTNNDVDLNIMEGGLSKLLKANEGTTYEIPISANPDKFSTYLDGMPFKNNVEWVIFGDQSHVTSVDQYVGCGITIQEGTTQGVVLNDGPGVGTSTYGDGRESIVKVSNKTITMDFNVKVKFKMNSNSNAGFVFYMYDRNNVYVSTINISPSTAYSNGQIVYIDQNVSIPFIDGSNIAIVSIGGGQYTILGGSISLNYEVTFDSTLCECISWMSLFEKLTDKLTNGKYGCRSNYLTSLTNQAITSGQAIRKYQSTSVIKTSFNDFFKACQRWGLGLGIENNELRIEPHAYFFGSSTAIELGEVKDLEFSVAEDLVFNTIKVGYSNQTYDNVNGKDEFNVTQQYTTPHTRIVKELDIICPYRADSFGIELTRLKMFGKDTTDNKADNDTFLMEVEKGSDYNYYNGSFTTQINTGSYYFLIPSVLFQLANGSKFTANGNEYTILNTSYLITGFTYIQVTEVVTNTAYTGAITLYDSSVYHLSRPVYSPLTGVAFPDEVFNIGLSPKRSLNNNGAYIHSVLDLQDSAKITFQSGEKNSELIAGTVTEKADITIYDLPAKLFRPYYFTFKTQVVVNLAEIMKLTPYDLVSFTYKGNTYKGFFWDGGIAPADMDSQTWKLLSAPDNDLTKLI